MCNKDLQLWKWAWKMLCPNLYCKATWRIQWSNPDRALSLWWFHKSIPSLVRIGHHQINEASGNLKWRRSADLGFWLKGKSLKSPLGAKILEIPYSLLEKFFKVYVSELNDFSATFKMFMFTFSLTNFWVEQMVTAGNGTIPIEVLLSSKVIITGCWSHFVQMLKIENVHRVTDKANATAHHTLEGGRVIYYPNGMTNLTICNQKKKFFEFTVRSSVVLVRWNIEHRAPLNLNKIPCKCHRRAAESRDKIFFFVSSLFNSKTEWKSPEFSFRSSHFHSLLRSYHGKLPILLASSRFD